MEQCQRGEAMIWTDRGISILFGSDAFQIDRLVIVFLISSAAFSFLAFFVLKFLDSRKDGMCRWKAAPENNRQPFKKWQCQTCVIEAYTTGKRPPKECKKTLKSLV
jgi:hypothetical protein